MASDATGTSQDNAADGADTQATKGNPLRRVALTVLLLACLLFVIAVFMERRTPSSSQATVSAYVVGIAPEVTGRVIEVGVADNSGVKPGQMLFRIDPQQYQLAVAEAEARLARVGQTIGASTASVDAVQARLVEARAIRDNVQEQANRAMELVKRGVYAKAKYDEAKAAVDQANASVVAAEADLKQAQEELGPAGADNPQLKEALAALERAQLDLLRTTVLAPAEGVVTNLQLSVGGVVGAGQSAMTFIDVGTVWITAAFKENSLENVAAGNHADVLVRPLARPGFRCDGRERRDGRGPGKCRPQDRAAQDFHRKRMGENATELSGPPDPRRGQAQGRALRVAGERGDLYRRQSGDQRDRPHLDARVVGPDLCQLTATLRTPMPGARVCASRWP